MKTLVKMIGGLLIGCLAGVLIAAVGITLFTDTTFSEFFAKFGQLELSEGLTVLLVSIAVFLVSLFLLVILHEAGHLAFGLMSGYRFVSFRIFNFTFIKLDGRLRVKRFSVAGTGGQCLLTPPDKPLSEIPIFWYHLGGVAANILALLLVSPLLCLDLPPLMRTSLVIFCLTDLFLILTNGIPMRLGGIANDAHNVLELAVTRGANAPWCCNCASTPWRRKASAPRICPPPGLKHPPTSITKTPWKFRYH